MDPLSITASAITLIAAAGSIATTVNTFTRSLRTADTRLTELATELAHLTTFLKSVQSSLKGHNAYDLAHFDDSLWQQSEIALSQCQTTLNELSLLVTEIRQSAGKAVLGRRARLAASLTTRSVEIQGFRDRMAKSNLALQTILQTITVALSLRNNVSQTLILQALDDLNASIERVISRSWQKGNRTVKSLHVGARHTYADAQLNRNLRDLAHAAKQFHNTASSTASSAANSARSDDEGSNAPWQSYPGAEISLAGDFSEDRREIVEDFVRKTPTALSLAGLQATRRAPSFPRAGSPFFNLAPMREEKDVVAEDDEDDETDEEDDAEFELAFLRGLQELISHHIRVGNYAKAIDFINDAMSNSAVSSSSNLLRTIQSQLVLARLLQGQWRLASSLLTTTLAQVRKDRTGAVCSLLHGLAIACLAEYAFDDALSACKMALYGRRRLHKRGCLATEAVNETVGLFATIYNMTGDYVRAEVLRGQMPNGFTYEHPKSVIAFLLEEDSLKDLLQGEIKAPPSNNISVVPGVFELPDRADNPAGELIRRPAMTAPYSPLRLRICEHERLERDTAKEVFVVEPTSPNDAEDEASPITGEDSPSPAPLRRRLTQLFKPNRQRRAVPVKPIEEQEDEANDSGYGTSSTTDTSPSSPWRLAVFSPLKGGKTKKFLRKTAIRQEKDVFRVLNMERMSKVDALNHHVSTPIESPVMEEETWKPRWHSAEQLAELHTVPERRDEEDETLGLADQPAHQAAPYPRFFQGTTETTAPRVDSEPTGDVAPAGALSAGPTEAGTRASKLQIPQPTEPPKAAPLSIPSLDPLNLTEQLLAPRLAKAVHSLSKCFASIPSMKTLGDMEMTRERLTYLARELTACGYDRTVVHDVDAAEKRLGRKCDRLRRKMKKKEENRLRKEQARREREAEAGRKKSKVTFAPRHDIQMIEAPISSIHNGVASDPSPEPLQRTSPELQRDRHCLSPNGSSRESPAEEQPEPKMLRSDIEQKMLIQGTEPKALLKLKQKRFPWPFLDSGRDPDEEEPHSSTPGGELTHRTLSRKLSFERQANENLTVRTT